MTNSASKLLLTAAAVMFFTATAASADVVYLDFENIAPHPNNSDVLINEYYNGGTATNGASGPNLGVQFTSPALLLCLNTASVNCSNTSRGGQGIATSRLGALYFPTATPIMNVAAGFGTGFSGVYSAPFTPGTTVSIYDGLDATGTLLASLSLPLTTNGGTSFPNSTGSCAAFQANSYYCPFETFALTFAGTARSVAFTGTVNQQVFDDFTFGSATVGGVPEPTSWAMLILGLGAVGGSMRYRRGKTTVRFA